MINTSLKNVDKIWYQIIVLLTIYNAVSAPVAAIREALTERLHSVRETASLLYNRMVDNMGYGQETLKDIAEKEAEEEQQHEEDIDLTPNEQERAHADVL